MTPIQWIPFNELPPGKVRRGPHQMTKKVCNWAYCARCGLVALKNEATRLQMKKECVTVED